MKIDLLHNKIIRDTATERFRESVRVNLSALISDACGEVDGILMYEDHIADGFNENGAWYYPLTVFRGGEPSVVWIKWQLGKRSFPTPSPYAYNGEELLEFDLADYVPPAFEEKISGRAISYDASTIKLGVRAAADDPLILAGRYSQTFVDELARQITHAIGHAMAVEGLADSSVELELVFAPGTYMEHTSENVTYRRLLLVDGASAPRDFWVKWTRVGGGNAYTVSDHVSGDEIIFELGEDVSQKIREKEFRFLCSSNPDKYQSAMGKRTVTEWRDIIKRATRRGELIKLESDLEIAERDTEVDDKLKAVLGTLGDLPITDPASSTAPEADDFGSLMDLVRTALENTEGRDTSDEQSDGAWQQIDEEPLSVSPTLIDENDDEDEPLFTLPDLGADLLYDEKADEDEPEDEAEAEEESPEPAYEPTEEELLKALLEEWGKAEEEEAEAVADEPIPDECDEPTMEVCEVVNSPTDEPAVEEQAAECEQKETDTEREERIRAEIEAKLRLEYEAQARARAELELERLRLESEQLRRENERLARQARDAEQRHAQAIQDHIELSERTRATEEQLRAELDARARQEARERDRLAEAARLAVEEQRRLDAEERERAARLEAEEAARLEAERLENERRLEAERIRREAEERARAAAVPEESPYISKRAKIIFRRSVDLNVISRIREIIEQTLIIHGKEHINIHIKAYQEDKESINLDILKVPRGESDLVISIVKAIGNAKIGVTKIILE